MAITRIQARWTGFNGAPGYSSFYFEDTVTEATVLAQRQRVSDFLVALRPYLPTGVAVAVQQNPAIIDEATGQILDYGPNTDGVSNVVGTGSGGYSAASGAVVNWNTSIVRAGRRVRGRTFLVPLSNSAYESDGTLSVTALEVIRDAADEMVGTGFDSGLVIWARPSGAGAGLAAPVVGSFVPDLAAVLRSRRD